MGPRSGRRMPLKAAAARADAPCPGPSDDRILHCSPLHMIAQNNPSPVLDMLIIGAGPAGLATAIAAERHHLSYLVVEKGCLVNSIYHFPVNMVFFTTPELLEVGGLPLVTSGEKPRRVEALDYYRKVADACGLRLSLFDQVTAINTLPDGTFRVTSLNRQGNQLRYSRRVVLATGYYDHPNLLNIPGEELPKVCHYYTEPHSYYGLDVAVIGGRNSAAETALDLFRHGAKVTLIHRGCTLGKSIKYWVLPDIQNRIDRGEIQAFMETQVMRVDPESLTLGNRSGEWTIPNDFVFALTGYRPDIRLLEAAGVQVDPETLQPQHDETTLETNVPGLYVAGGITAGLETNRVFIENGRLHGQAIVKQVLAGLTAKQ
jgi:thioredoxin reductase (NADPH)